MSNFKQDGHLAYTFRLVSWKKGSINLDLGGGQSNTATRHGVTNLVYDPSRSSMHNEHVMKHVKLSPVDTVTVNNVLNVIPDKDERLKLIQLAAKVLKPVGTAYFLIYEGNKTASGSATQFCWQNNLTAHAYLPEIETCFGSVHISRNLIIAKNPRTS